MDKKTKRVIELNVYKKEMILEYLELKSMMPTEHFFDYKYCYFPDLTDLLQNLKISKTSPLYVFIPMGATPRLKDGDRKTQSNFRFMFKDEKIFYKLKTHDALLRYALGNMLELLNLATYIYANIPKDDKKLKTNIIRLLIIAALTEYDNMYTPRGKHEFAYYLKQFIKNQKDLSGEVKPFNTNTSKSENAKTLAKFKQFVDSMFHSGQDMITSYIANIAITFGKLSDKKISDMSEQYFIDISFLDLSSTLDTPIYKCLFITNFK
jgi:hypothetical protein